MTRGGQHSLTKISSLYELYMATNQLAELAKCLTQVGEIVKELTGTLASTSSAERPATLPSRIGAATSSVHH